MVSMREHITEDQLEAFKKHLKKGYFNALIKPKALNKYVSIGKMEFEGKICNYLAFCFQRYSFKYCGKYTLAYD